MEKEFVPCQVRALDAAEILAVHEITVGRLVEAGKLKGRWDERRPRRLWINEESLLALAAQRIRAEVSREALKEGRLEDVIFEPGDLLSSGEVAAFLAASRSTVYSLASNGSLWPLAFTSGGNLRIRFDAAVRVKKIMAAQGRKLIKEEK